MRIVNGLVFVYVERIIELKPSSLLNGVKS